METLESSGFPIIKLRSSKVWVCASSSILCSSAVRLLNKPDNRIKSWDELDRVKELPELENLLFVGNPFYEAAKDDAKYLTLKKLPNSKNIDGSIVDAPFQAKSASLPDQFPPPVK